MSLASGPVQKYKPLLQLVCKMKKLLLILTICLFFIGCSSNKEEAYPKVSIHESVVVSVVSEPPEAEEAATGTGIVVDKNNGLILTARHGVYNGNVINYKNTGLFKNIKIIDRSRKLRLDGYVVHLSPNYDLAIVKVDHQFSSQAPFAYSDLLERKDEIEFRGFPDGQYGVYKGYISNTKEKYLNLDMVIAEGMSGGPILVPGKGIVGIVLFKQKIGGNALRSENIQRYLSKAIPQANKVRKKTYSLRLNKVILNESKTQYAEEEKPELYVQLIVNGEKIMETEEVEATGKEILWSNSDKNSFNITLLPGDRIEIKVIKDSLLGWIKKSVFFETTFEALPREGLPDLDREIVADDNSIFFEQIQ